MNKIELGKIIKPQGIKGEVKIDISSYDKDLFASLKEVYIDDKCYRIESKKNLVNGVFFKLEGIDDRNQAESFRGKIVCFDRGNMPKLPKGRYLISDIVGCEVVVDGKVAGMIKEILQYGSADVYVVEGTMGEKDFMFPCLKKVLKSVDVESKTIVLNKEILEQIVVYED